MTLADAGPDALVILVHGTYAAGAADAGNRWWQAGSPSWDALMEKLPPGTRLTDVGEVFHWSGENSERERIRAGRELLDYITGLEAAGRSYHLVGHSHGGSVIWHAMRLAKKSGKRLDHLQSWSTVGTPFLHYRTRGALSAANLLNAMLAVVLIRPALITFHQLSHLLAASLFGVEFNLRVGRARPDGVTAILQAPFRKLLELLGVPLIETPSGLQIGSYDPASGQPLAEYLLGTREGLLVIAVAVISAFVFLNLARLVVAPILESLYHRADRRLEKKLMRQFGDRWLAVWSPHDEAINGLRATLDLSLAMLPRMTVREPILFSDHLSVLARPYEWLFTPLYNTIIRPVFNRWICSSIVRAAQGANRPAAEVVAILPTPVTKSSDSACPPLPDWLDEQLVDEANRHAREMAPQLRNLLAQTSILTGLDAFAHTLTGKELVHTSYFDHAEILELLALNVAWGNSQESLIAMRERVKPQVWQWFLQNKATRGPLPQGLQEQPARRMPRIQPRRRILKLNPQRVDSTEHRSEPRRAA